MKKLLIPLVALVLFTITTGFTPTSTYPESIHASSIMIPVGSKGQKISLLELSTISKASLEKLSGRKMNRLQSLAFKVTQRKLQKGINSKGELVNKKLKYFFEPEKQTGFHAGGFLLGFFLSFIGVLIAYLINDEKRKNRVKWAWIGCGIYLLFVLLLFFAIDGWQIP
jgi:hypothetical protein